VIQTKKFPGYAPEANPNEMVWQHAKHGRLANFAPADTAELRTELIGELAQLQRSPKILAAFIRHARVPIRLRS
jgi:hypothetical protein